MIAVETQHDPVNGVVRLTIADNGPGIPPGEREKVFRRLYRLERSRSTPGTGLGLSLVNAIAELHDAPIRLEDAEPPAKKAVPAQRIVGKDRHSLTETPLSRITRTARA